MEVSEIINIVLAGGLVTLIVAVFTLKSTVRRAQADARKAHEEANKARAEALKAEAEVETVRMDNAEHATRILLDNIVKPLKDELNETRKLLQSLREAIDRANDCEHRSGCPILHGLRKRKGQKRSEGRAGSVSHRDRVDGQRGGVRVDGHGADKGVGVGGETDESEPHTSGSGGIGDDDESGAEEPP